MFSRMKLRDTPGIRRMKSQYDSDDLDVCSGIVSRTRAAWLSMLVARWCFCGSLQPSSQPSTQSPW